MTEITREQIDKAIKAAMIGHVYLSDFLGPGINWRLHAPDYVCRLWISPPRPPQEEHIAALTRWRDSLPVSKVARWDAEHLDYELSPPMEWEEDWGTRKQYKTHSRNDARAWGYTIEGGPAEDSPEEFAGLVSADVMKRAEANMVAWHAAPDSARQEAAQFHPDAIDPVAEDSPERLKARREALGLSLTQAANLPGLEPFTAFDLQMWEAVTKPSCTARAYAAALSAEERWRAVIAGRRIGKSINTAAQFGEEPHDWGDETPEPAPEVVDVPQPDPEIAAIATCLEALLALDPVTRKRAMWYLSERLRAEAEREQRPAPAPERPEPRYKVGDWVRAPARPRVGVFQIIGVHPRYPRVFYGGPAYWWHEDALTPALDPALHETARWTHAWLRNGAYGVPPQRYRELPGYEAWNTGGDICSWAAQLERLLGDA